MKNCSLFLFLFLVLAGTTLAQNVPSYVPTNGLVGWWPFNGNANDESGNGNNGTVNGATLTNDRFGNVNSAYSFDGIDDGIITSDVNFPYGNSDRTISVWINKIDGVCSIPIRYGAHSQSNGCWILHNTNCNSYYPNGGIVADFFNENVIGNNTGLLSLGLWGMITISIENQDCKLYLNGQLIGQDIVTINTISFLNQFYIGSDLVSNPNYFFKGKIDDIGVWGRALTQQEITNLYNASTTTNTCPTLPSNLQTGLVGYWPFCGNANDESGNGNNGTVNGATLTSDRFGNINSAYEFDGINNWIDVANNLTINFQDEFSISVWVKSNQNNYNAGIIGRWNDFDGAVQVGQEEFALVVDDNVQNMYATIRTNTSPSANLYYQYNNSGYNNNQWNLFIFSFSNNIISLYKNGVFIGNALTSGTINNYIQNLEIGRYAGGQPTGGNTHFNGVLDDIGIWNRALTTAEVSQLYAAQSVNPNNGGGSNSVVTNFPSGISYQAVARDSVGKPLANAAMTVRFTLRDSSVSGTAVYAETHAITTNALGLFTAVIGNGTPTTATYSTINWMGPQKFLSVEINTGSGFQLIGNQQMLSVPYSILSSKSIESTKIKNSSLPVFIDNAAATTGGLQAGDMYRTAAGVLMIVY